MGAKPKTWEALPKIEFVKQCVEWIRGSGPFLSDPDPPIYGSMSGSIDFFKRLAYIVVPREKLADQNQPFWRPNYFSQNSCACLSGNFRVSLQQLFH